MDKIIVGRIADIYFKEDEGKPYRYIMKAKKFVEACSEHREGKVDGPIGIGNIQNAVGNPDDVIENLRFQIDVKLRCHLTPDYDASDFTFEMVYAEVNQGIFWQGERRSGGRHSVKEVEECQA